MRRPKKKVYDYKQALRADEKKKKISKKKEDLTPKDEVKELFFSWFRKHRKIGQIMTKQDVVTHILTKLDSKQNKALEIAMNELQESNFMEMQSDGVSLKLCEKGFNSL